MQDPTRSITVPSRRLARRLIVAAGAALLCMAFASSAFAAPPNLVISDSNMRANYSMSADQIQAFLNTKNGPLKNMSFARHDGGPSATAAVIIWEACQQWGISPRAMLTMLQKEQSLIDSPSTSQSLQYRYDWAIGMGVPDSGNRNYTFQGFGNQLWYGTMRLDGYGELKPGVTYINKWKGPGDTTYMPSGAAPVNISTWKLYVYNPSITGNTNFYNIYNKYFGDPAAGFSFTPITGPPGSVFRFYNTKLGSHFYTASVDEANATQNRLYLTFRYEGPAYIADQAKNSTPLYRFYNKKNGAHFYTADEAEKTRVLNTLAAVYSLDGPAYNVSLAPAVGAATVYRFFNMKNGTHFYTASLSERDDVIAKLGYLYNYEGPSFYVVP